MHYSKKIIITILISATCIFDFFGMQKRHNKKKIIRKHAQEKRKHDQGKSFDASQQLFFAHVLKEAFKLPGPVYSEIGLRILGDPDVPVKNKKNILQSMQSKFLENEELYHLFQCFVFCVDDWTQGCLASNKNTLLLKALLNYPIRGSQIHRTAFFSFLRSHGANPGKVMKKLILFKDVYGLELAAKFEKIDQSAGGRVIWPEVKSLCEQHNYDASATDLSDLQGEVETKRALLGLLYGLMEEFPLAKVCSYRSIVSNDERYIVKKKTTLFNFLKEKLFLWSTDQGISCMYTYYMLKKWNSAKFSDSNKQAFKLMIDFYKSNKDSEPNIQHFDAVSHAFGACDYTDHWELFRIIAEVNKRFYCDMVSTLLPYFLDEFELQRADLADLFLIHPKFVEAYLFQHSYNYETNAVNEQKRAYNYWKNAKKDSAS